VEFISNHYTKRAFTRHLPRVRTVVSTEVSITSLDRQGTTTLLLQCRRRPRLHVNMLAF